MAQPYVGEIRMFGGSFAPAGWVTCDGQLLPISEYETLFQLIGTSYGGDGQSTFAVPSLGGRVPVCMGTNPGTGTTYTAGALGGTANVTLSTNQIPNHTHPIVADGNHANTGSPAGAYFAEAAPVQLYSIPNDPNNPAPPNIQNMNAGMLPAQGGSQPHSNVQPYVGITFILSLFGIFPSVS